MSPMITELTLSGYRTIQVERDVYKRQADDAAPIDFVVSHGRLVKQLPKPRFALDEGLVHVLHNPLSLTG